MKEDFRLTSHEQKVLKDAVDIAVNFFSSFAMVRRDPEGITLPMYCPIRGDCFRSVCSDRYEEAFRKNNDTFFECPKNAKKSPGVFCNDTAFRKPLVDADMVLGVAVSELSEDVLAASAPCSYDVNTHKPLSASMVVGTGFLRVSTSTLHRGGLHVLAETLTHEINHGLYFHPRLYKRFVGGKKHIIKSWRHKVYPETTDIAMNEPFYGLSFPNMLYQARLYTGCPFLKYVEMENVPLSGTQLSHFEEDFLQYEQMRPDMSRDHLFFSAITMGLMEDTGWYKVDYSKAEPMPPLPSIGKNKCEALKSCFHRVFYSQALNKCHPGRRSYYTMISPQINNPYARCPTTRVNTCYWLTNFNEKLRCLDHKTDTAMTFFKRIDDERVEDQKRGLNISTASCYKINCDSGNVQFESDGLTYTCDKPGQVIEIAEKYGKNHHWDILLHDFPDETLNNISHYGDYEVRRKVECPDFCSVCEQHAKCNNDVVYDLKSSGGIQLVDDGQVPKGASGIPFCAFQTISLFVVRLFSQVL